MFRLRGAPVDDNGRRPWPAQDADMMLEVDGRLWRSTGGVPGSCASMLLASTVRCGWLASIGVLELRDGVRLADGLADGLA